jgi:transcription elongation factor Elf1
MNCPNGHGAMEEKQRNKTVHHKKNDVDIIEKVFVCPVCNLAAGTIQSAGEIQIIIDCGSMQGKKEISD